MRLSPPREWQLGWCLAAAALGTGAVYTAPSFGLDPSWVLGINLGRIDRLRWGPELDFTYGPWGFVDQASLVSRSAVALSLVGLIASGWVLAVLVVRALRPVVGPRARIAVLLAVVAPMLALSTVSTRALAAVVAGAVLVLRPGLSARATRIVCVGMAVTSSFLVFDKFSIGVAAVAVTVLALLAARLELRTRLAALALLVLAPLAWWLAAGQSLGALPEWVRLSLAIASCYPDAMSVEMPSLAWQYVGLAVLSVVIGWQILRCPGERRSKAATLLLAAGVVLIVLRIGFTRHDSGHPLGSFVILGFLAIALVSATRTRTLIGVGAAAMLLAGATVNAAYWTLVDPVSATSKIVSAVTVVADQQSQVSQLDAARSQVLQQARVDPSVVTALRGHRVAADPWEISAVWAEGLDWRPVPVMQTYSASTQSLDDTNAAALTAADGPDAVLKSAAMSIDYRNPLWESPAYIVTMICNFDVAVGTPTWSALLRAPDRCGAPETVSSVPAAPGVPLAVPELPRPGIMVAVVSIPETAERRVANALFKPRTALYLGLQSGQYRLPRGLLGAPLVLRLSPTSGWDAAMRGTPDSGSLTLPDVGTVTFQFIPFTR